MWPQHHLGCTGGQGRPHCAHHQRRHASGTQGTNCWFTGPVTIHFSCADATSGIGSCPANQTVTADGVTTVNGTATDVAGNSASTSITVKVDRTAPTGVITTANGSLFILGGQITGTAADATSSIAGVTVTFTGSSSSTVTATLNCDAAHKACTWSVPVPLLPLLVLGGYTARATIRDLAGNTFVTAPINFTAVL